MLGHTRRDGELGGGLEQAQGRTASHRPSFAGLEWPLRRGIVPTTGNAAPPSLWLRRPTRQFGCVTPTGWGGCTLRA
jgi:hypothetical protein